MSQLPSQSLEVCMGEENRPRQPTLKENMANTNKGKNNMKGSDTNLPRRQDVLQELNSNTLQENIAPAPWYEKFVEKETKPEQEPTKYGGIVINPEDALLTRQLELLESTDNNRTEAYHYSSLHPRSQDKQGIIEREFNYEFVRPSESETTRIGGIVIDSEDIQSSLRDQYKEGENRVQLQKASQDDLHPMMASRGFYYEREVPDRREDVVKTGGIVIRPEDCLPYKKNEIHVDPRTGLSYAMLKPWEQVKEEQSGIVHNFFSTGSKTRDEKPKTSSAAMSRNDDISITRDTQEEPTKYGGIIVKPEDVLPSQRSEMEGSDMVQLHPRADNISSQPGGMMSRGFCYEYERPQRDEDIVKTGGIVIGVADMLPDKRAELGTAGPNAFVMLKPWSKIKEEQGGIVHNPYNEQERKTNTGYINDTWDKDAPREEREKTGAVQEQSQVHERDFNYEYVRETEQEPVKLIGMAKRDESGKLQSEGFDSSDLPTRSTLNDLDSHQPTTETGPSSLNYVCSSIC